MAAQADGMKILADERYARTDTSAEAQALKLMSVHPQAIMMGNSATPAALPVVALRHRGFKGGIYGNHGIVSPGLHQGGRRGGRGRDRRHLAAGRLRPVAGRQRDQAGGGGVHGGVREEVRAAERQPVRRLQL